MKISSLFSKGKPVFSLEIFPPKKIDSFDSIYKTLVELKSLNPDYISVTYGAGGTNTDIDTCKIASYIKNKLNIEVLAHLTCINHSKEQITEILENMESCNIENILALRGDVNNSLPYCGAFNYAGQLSELIKKRSVFHISGACYPEGHKEAESLSADIENLKRKINSGTEHLISQLFFDNSLFFKFIEKIRKAGIFVPVQAGIMPITNKKQIEKMVSLCGAAIPPKLIKIINKYEYSTVALRDAGIDYAIEQITELLQNNTDGVHIFTMNNYENTSDIYKGVSQFFN